MKLQSVTIANFRSITSAYKINLADYSVLVGSNNEGKSNILKAIVYGMSALQDRGTAFNPRTSLGARADIDGYSWRRDFPLGLQTKNLSSASEVTLEFQLASSEFTAFHKLTGLNLATALKVKVLFLRGSVDIELLLQGKGKKRLPTESIDTICKFISDRISIQYIPALRTAKMAERVIEEILSARLAALAKDAKYKEHIKAIQELQAPVLLGLGRELTAMVQGFIPDITAVTLSSRFLTRAISSSAEIMVKDRAETPIDLKGDGVKSLLAIALIKHSLQANLGSKELVLAIEEPESHLHPQATHRLREVLQALSAECQVLVATHCAPLVNRENVSSNILVQDGYASPAKTISEIRDVLGVKVSDNMSSARLVLLVEGSEDEKLLRIWLCEHSSTLRLAFAAGEITIDPLNGADNLGYKASLYKAQLCEVHAFLDNDTKGRSAAERAVERESLKLSEIQHTVISGANNSELEDFIQVDLYLPELNEMLGTSMAESQLTGTSQAWSERLKLALSKQAKALDANLEAKIKNRVCSIAASKGLASLIGKRTSSIFALTEALESKLASKKYESQKVV